MKDENGNSKGFGFCCFENEDDAKKVGVPEYLDSLILFTDFRKFLFRQSSIIAIFI